MFALTFCSILKAATLTVNNKNPRIEQYSTVQAAVDAAASGDIILIGGIIQHSPIIPVLLLDVSSRIYFRGKMTLKTNFVGNKFPDYNLMLTFVHCSI